MVTNQFEFSLPMPYKITFIDKLLEINNKIKKSKITSLYFSLPSNSTDYTGFEQGRYNWSFTTDFNYWKPLIEYSIKKGYDFIYLLNSPKIYNPEFDNLECYLNKLDNLINNLKNIGCNKVRICNPQLMEYINKKYPFIELYISTSAEFKIIKEYTNLFSMFKNIKEFVPAFDLNKNFMFLKNIKKLFPDIKIELMVNEGCLFGCPLRNFHNLFITGNTQYIPNSIFSSSFFIKKCQNYEKLNPFFSICHPNIIYPWDIEEYSKMGINKFKLVGRNNNEFDTGEYIKYYEYYLTGVDNIENILNIPIKYFNNYIYPKKNEIQYRVKEVKKYLPKIKHFVKEGHLCLSICGNECNYCYKCAKKIETVFNKKNIQPCK